MHLSTGARINPNCDMIGGYALLNVRGHQTTLRFNRCWRRTTDQSRYSQPGTATGFIKLNDQRWDVEPEGWHGARDHSWGLYAERPPLSPVASLLPPREESVGPKRALRFWTCFRSEPFSGFWHVHETPEGEQAHMNDVFGTPFGGTIYRGWDAEPIILASVKHDIVLDPKTLMLPRAEIELNDTSGGVWHQSFEPAASPWVVNTMGYHPGSWKDGGAFFTWHGSEELAIEWDHFDFSDQPTPWTPYAVSGEAAATSFGDATRRESLVQGPEYLCKITTTAPDGTVRVGAGQVEFFLNGHQHCYNPAR